MSDPENVVTTPAGGDTSASAPAPATGEPSAAPSATSTGTGAAPTMQPSGEGMVPSYRLRETREAVIREYQAQLAQARQEWEAREAAYKNQMEQIQRQLHALVGVTPNNEIAEVEAVRNQFARLYPGLAALEERAQDLLGLTERSGDLDLQSRHYWQSYGRSSMERLYGLAEKSLGAPLTAEGKRALHAGFTGYVSSDPQLVERYTSDPSVVDEYWSLVSSSLIDPVRRAATATVQQQTTTGRNLPQDRPAGVPPVQAAPKPKDLDERIASGWAAYQAAKKG